MGTIQDIAELKRIERAAWRRAQVAARAANAADPDSPEACWLEARRQAANAAHDQAHRNWAMACAADAGWPTAADPNGARG